MPTNQMIQSEFDNGQADIALWFNKHVLNPSPGSPYLPIRELFNNEVLFLANMQRLKNGLSIMLNQVNKKEQALIESHMGKIDALLALYDKLDFLSAIKPPDNDIHKVALILQEKYQNPVFAECMDQFASLVVTGKQIDGMYKKYEDELLKNKDFTSALASKINDTIQQRSLTAYTSMPFQKIMRFQMPLEEALKCMKKGNNTSSIASIESSVEMTKSQAKRVQDVAMDALEKLTTQASKTSDMTSEGIIEWCEKNVRKLIDKLTSTLSESSDPSIVSERITKQLNEFSERASTTLHSISQSTEPLVRHSLVGMLNSAHAGIDQLAKLSVLKTTNNSALMRAINIVINNLISKLSKQNNVVITKDTTDVLSRNSLTEERKVLAHFKHVIKERDTGPDKEETDESIKKQSKT